MGILNGLRADSAKNFQLDAGILVKNIKDFSDITKGELLGATSGGGSFTAIPELRNIFEDIDGARGKYAEGDVIDNWETKLSATLKEVTKENITSALVACDVVVGSGESATYDTIQARNEIKDTDYIENICWCGTLKGSTSPIIIELKNAINEKGFELAFTDKGTGGIAVEFAGRFKLANPNNVPFTIHYPKTKTALNQKK